MNLDFDHNKMDPHPFHNPLCVRFPLLYYKKNKNEEIKCRF